MSKREVDILDIIKARKEKNNVFLDKLGGCIYDENGLLEQIIIFDEKINVFYKFSKDDLTSHDIEIKNQVERLNDIFVIDFKKDCVCFEYEDDNAKDTQIFLKTYSSVREYEDTCKIYKYRLVDSFVINYNGNMSLDFIVEVGEEIDY